MNNSELINLYVKEHSVGSFAISQGKCSYLVYEVQDELNLSPICVAHFRYYLKILSVCVFLDRESINLIYGEEDYGEEDASYYHSLPNFPGGSPILSQWWEWGLVDFGDVLAFLNEAKPPRLHAIA